MKNFRPCVLDLAAPKRLRKAAVAAVANRKPEMPATVPTPPLPTRNDATRGEPEHGVHEPDGRHRRRKAQWPKDRSVYDKDLRNLYEFRTQLAHICMVTRHGTGIAILVEYRRIWQELYSNRQTPEGSACYIVTCGADYAAQLKSIIAEMCLSLSRRKVT